ncbi:oxidoreductase [Acrocarpospora corrugata]|uniref:Oxidoreductase n=1 Tax=Acrocarpospora corrugata TaxID=35763 RepID=A0A5M3VVB1_9ACTN|nr:FAD-dependent oxidoreductase [Acrocarpospora corrugata]GES00727.1 oxidoreductase [Acrocarpospora corrugata]
MPDVVVIGAGVVGAACAYYAARAGLSVTVVDQGAVAGGTTGAGEGNVLVSDKEPGPELDLASLSAGLWSDLAAEVGGFEYEPKGGLVVAETPEVLTALTGLAAKQESSGVRAEVVTPEEYEPNIARGLAGGVYYPQDAQVQPMLAAARLLHASGAQIRTGVRVTGFTRSGDRITGVRTDEGDLPAGAVVNAAGTWAGDIAALAGLPLPVLPRRGFILVTEPLPEPLIHHKVYTAAYVTNVASEDEGLETSAVVEGTPSGPVLIGASRERVGYDRTVSYPVLARLAEQAVALFPALATRKVIRAYCGFRPYCPDHLPVIGPDPRAPGLYHATGHEGAGIGLAPATGLLISRVVTGYSGQPGRPIKSGANGRSGPAESGGQLDLDLFPFRPERFT